MRLAIIAGRAGDGTCGVADHSLFLAIELSKHCEVFFFSKRSNKPRPEYESYLKNSRVSLIEVQGFSHTDFSNILSHIREVKADILHLQYPAREYARSLLPIFVSIARSAFPAYTFGITLHEYLASHPLRKLASRIISSRSDFIIVPSLAGYRVLSKSFSKKCFFIPDGAFFHYLLGDYVQNESIPLEREERILYFGLPSKTKGIGEMIKLVALLRRNNKLNKLKLAIVGTRVAISSEEKEFVELLPQLDVKELYHLAGRCLLLLFPFPFDTHRSSLINGLILPAPIYCFGVEEEVCRRFPEHLPIHSESLSLEENYEALTRILLSLIEDFSQEGIPAINRQRVLLRELSMEKIANEHLAIYNRFLSVSA